MGAMRHQKSRLAAHAQVRVAASLKGKGAMLDGVKGLFNRSSLKNKRFLMLEKRGSGVWRIGEGGLCVDCQDL